MNECILACWEFEPENPDSLPPDEPMGMWGDYLDIDDEFGDELDEDEE